MVGKEISVSELMEDIKRDIPFYDQSGGGVTFTGGEPLFQGEFLLEALHACKDMGIQYDC
jgi:pyruvate formate lyase activating enzyme